MLNFRTRKDLEIILTYFLLFFREVENIYKWVERAC